MDAAEQRWRAGDFVPSFANPEPYDENETTLTPDQDVSLSETLTENNVTEAANVNEAINLTFTLDSQSTGLDENDSKDDSKLYQSFEETQMVDESGDGDEVFEDCVDDDGTKPEGNEHLKPGFDRVNEKYSLEMKLALDIEDK